MSKKFPKFLAAVCWMISLAKEVTLVNAEGKNTQALHNKCSYSCIAVTKANTKQDLHVSDTL